MGKKIFPILRWICLLNWPYGGYVKVYGKICMYLGVLTGEIKTRSLYWHCQIICVVFCKNRNTIHGERERAAFQSVPTLFRNYLQGWIISYTRPCICVFSWQPETSSLRFSWIRTKTALADIYTSYFSIDQFQHGFKNVAGTWSPTREIIHPLKLVDYQHIQDDVTVGADPWFFGKGVQKIKVSGSLCWFDLIFSKYPMKIK